MPSSYIQNLSVYAEYVALITITFVAWASQ